VAYPNTMRESRGTESREQLERAAQFERGCSIGMEAGPDVAHADSERLEKHRMFDAMLSFRSSETGASTESTKTNVADSDKIMRNGSRRTRHGRAESSDGGETMADATNSGNVWRDGELEPAQGQVRGHRGSAEDGRQEWWATEPDVR